MVSLAGTPLLAGGFDRVELDPGTGGFLRSLPFDVPFLIVGSALPGTTEVRLRYQELEEEIDSPQSGLLPESLPALVSGVDRGGQFQFRMEALEPNRSLRFTLDLERRLDAQRGALYRNSVRELLDQTLAGWDEVDLRPELGEALLGFLVEALERAVNDGQVIATPRGSTSVSAPSPLLDEAADLRERSERLDALTRPVRDRQAARAAAVERYRDATGHLESELRALRDAGALVTLLAALGRDPELNPRNPHSPVALPAEAMHLVAMSDADLAASARGQSPSEAPLELSETLRPDEAEAFRVRYHRLAKALRDLREWLESLVYARASDPTEIQRLLASGDLTSEHVESLRQLASQQQGSMRRAEAWTEALEASAWEVQRALTARERELDRLAAEIEARGLAATILQRTETDLATSSAGWYVSMDLGIVYPPRLDRAALYVGANLYFRPVNKRASLRTHGTLAHRLALTLGVTITDIALEDETRIEPLLGESSNLVLGLGYRITPSIRLGAGALLFLKNAPNPLVTSRSLGATPYLSASFDVDLVGIFKRLSE